MHHHGEALRRLTKDDALVAQLQEDYTRAPLDTSDRAMVDYVAKLTSAPHSVTEKDIGDLRDAGFSDQAILDIAQITGYFAFVNRLADGLGVRVEGEDKEEQRD